MGKKLSGQVKEDIKIIAAALPTAYNSMAGFISFEQLTTEPRFAVALAQFKERGVEIKSSLRYKIANLHVHEIDHEKKLTEAYKEKGRRGVLLYQLVYATAEYKTLLQEELNKLDNVAGQIAKLEAKKQKAMKILENPPYSAAVKKELAHLEAELKKLRDRIPTPKIEEDEQAGGE